MVVTLQRLSIEHWRQQQFHFILRSPSFGIVCVCVGGCVCVGMYSISISSTITTQHNSQVVNIVKYCQILSNEHIIII